MNGMTYMRGSRKDYDDWARLGNVGWSYRDVLPYFIRSEDNQQVNSMDYGYHGIGGPLTVTQFPYHPPLSFALLDAGKELGSYMYIYNYIKARGTLYENRAHKEENGRAAIKESAMTAYPYSIRFL